MELERQQELQRQQDAIPNPAEQMGQPAIPDPAATLENNPEAFGLQYDPETGCYYEKE